MEASHQRLVANDTFTAITYQHRALRDSVTHELVTVGVTSRSGSGLDYLALGDSYLSGEGDVKNYTSRHYIRGTEGQDDCHLSSSYPFLLAKAWKILEGKFNTVACSGRGLYTIIRLD